MYVHLLKYIETINFCLESGVEAAELWKTSFLHMYIVSPNVFTVLAALCAIICICMFVQDFVEL